MIAILPVAEQDRAALLGRFGLSGPAFCLAASDGKECLGSAAYRLEGETMELLAAEGVDARLLDGLLRAALNAALDAGARTAVCTMPSLFPALKQLGFQDVPDNGTGSGKTPRMQAEIFGIFSRGCPGGCHQ